MPLTGQAITNKAPPILYPAGITSAEAAAMLSACLNVFELWDLNAEQSRNLLGYPSQRTFLRWRRAAVSRIPSDTIWRLGHILAIHKALRHMFVDPARGYEWIKKPNDTFNGMSALGVMLAGSPVDLARVRDYLDAECGSR